MRSVLTISEFQVAYVRDRTILKNNSLPLQIIRVYNKSQHKSDSGEVIRFNDSSESAEFGTSEKRLFTRGTFSDSQTRAFFSSFLLFEACGGDSGQNSRHSKEVSETAEIDNVSSIFDRQRWPTSSSKRRRPIDRDR